MARPIYSTQLLCVAPALPTNFVTCPTGVVMVLRDIDAVEQTRAGNTICEIQSPAGGDMVIFHGGTTIETCNFNWRGRQVLVGGESFNVKPSVGTWSVWVSGYLLTVP